ncbi:MAG: response regulator [Thermodesulfobacteriota bacterium]
MNTVRNKGKSDFTEETVLIVDDEDYVVDVVQEIISHWVKDVDCASSGKEALELILKNDYNYILLDMRMPDMNGMELYRNIKEQRPELASRVIFLTGDTESSDIRAFFTLTQTNFLSKPFAIRELLDLMGGMDA